MRAFAAVLLSLVGFSLVGCDRGVSDLLSVHAANAAALQYEAERHCKVWGTVALRACATGPGIPAGMAKNALDARHGYNATCQRSNTPAECEEVFERMYKIAYVEPTLAVGAIGESIK